MAEQDKKSKSGGGGKQQGAKPSAEEIARKKAAKAARKAEAEVETDEGAPQQPAPPARLVEHYKSKVVPALEERFHYGNQMAVPRIEKIVISMGLGKFATAGGEGKSNFEKAEKELAVIAGQRPVRTKAKKS